MNFRATIILACHNVEDFVGEAMDSILAQSLFSDFQVIPVDDGSTDSTREILRWYAAEHPENIFPIYFDDASGGPGRPRNAGLDQAVAPIVMFMDPDDRIHEDGYSWLLAAMEEHESDLFIATRFGVPEHAPASRKSWVDYTLPEDLINDESYALRLDLLERRPIILKSAYRRSLIEEHNLRFIEGITTSEDEIFDMKFILLAKKISKVNEVVYLYTIARTGSVTSKIKLKIYEDVEDVLFGLDDALLDYFGQSITSYRLMGLIRTFYLPKLLLLDPDETDDALELIHDACAKYGFDKLKLTENTVDQRIVELLEARQFSQLMLFFMNQKNSAASALVRAKNRKIGQLTRSMRRRAIRIPNKAAHRYGQAKLVAKHIRNGDIKKYRVANTPEGGFAQESNGTWLFMDRRDKGTDNGEALYRFVRDEQLHDDIAFVIREDCPDYQRLLDDGFRIIKYGTLEHWEALYGAEFLFTSHCDDVIIFPWLSFGRQIKKPLYKLVFLQHGIIRSDLSGWLGTKKYHLFCSSAYDEYNSLRNNIRYKLTPDNLKLTGLARHDLLVDAPADYVLVCPTWRSFLQNATPEKFEESDFFLNWSGLLNDPDFRAEVERAGMRIKLVLHSSFDKFTESFQSDELVEVQSFSEVESFADLVSGAVGMITDYSTISFDTLYLRRPVLFFNFEESQSHSMNTSAKIDLYEVLGWRLAEIADVTAAARDLAESKWDLDDTRRAAIGEFFGHADSNNRQRIIDAATTS